MLTVKSKLLENPKGDANRLAAVHQKRRLSNDWPEWDHADDHACTRILACVSGMPRKLRNKARLVVLQGWFDDSGKEGWPRPKTSPVYLLAGYIAPVRVWAAFADDWKKELDREPKLDFLHAKDAYTFACQFGKGSQWEKAWGERNEVERDKRLLAFARIIQDHLRPMWNAYNVPDRLGLTWMLSHDEYREFRDAMERHPLITKAERKVIKNPYFFGFQYVMGACLRYKGFSRTSDESIQILFDRDIDNKKRLEMGFKQWVEVVRLDAPHLLKQLVNEQAEFRDDKKHPELQAADLLAYHLRKYIYEITQMKNLDYAGSEIWSTLHNRRKIEFLDLRYEREQWRQLAGKVTQPFGVWGTIKPKGKL
jgi:hypothetical protein